MDSKAQIQESLRIVRISKTLGIRINNAYINDVLAEGHMLHLGRFSRGAKLALIFLWCALY